MFQCKLVVNLDKTSRLFSHLKQLRYFSVKTTGQWTNAADLVQCPQKESQALIVKLLGNQCICKLAYIKFKSPNPKMNLDVDYPPWMYVRENWLSPRQSRTNKFHVLGAETIGNLLAYVLGCTSAKERLVGRHFKARTIRGKFLLSISLYEKVLSIPVCCTGQMTCLTIIVKVTLTHWEVPKRLEGRSNLFEIQQLFSASTYNHKEHPWLRKNTETLCV